MTGSIDLTEAAQALGEYFGPRLVGGRDEGRQLMADALHERFGIDNREARRLIDALEHADAIRWIEAPTSPPETVAAIPGSVRPVWDEGLDVGYWQLELE